VEIGFAYTELVNLHSKFGLRITSGVEIARKQIILFKTKLVIGSNGILIWLTHSFFLLKAQIKKTDLCNA